ncbi:efflux RND transporter permease subunit, partial [Escherichia coli]|nr:efflux RND transporter permease subunit [Escherichia coli]
QLRVKTAAGLVPITNFAQIKPDHKQDTIRRVDGHRVINIKADMVEGYNLALELPKIAAGMEQLDLPEGIEYKIRGQNEEQENSSAFLQNAF